MPNIFISNTEQFINYMLKKNYRALNMCIEDYIPTKKTFYVSPANSLCYMDGGIDYPLSRIIMPNIEIKLKKN
jgi:O-acetyl-ADP-ribose deacetylase (regulator of RNase III)